MDVTLLSPKWGRAMLTYVLILTFAGFVTLAAILIPKAPQIAYTVPLATVLITFMGLRNYVSADWSMYVRIFQIYSTIPFRDATNAFQTEVGFGILNALAGYIGSDEHFVALTCAIIMVSGILVLGHYARVNLCLILFLAAPYFLFVVGMGYTRQSAAIGFAFATIAAYYRNQWWRAGILGILAVSFHYTAALFLCLLLAENWKRVLLFGSLGTVLIAVSGVASSGGRYEGYVQEGGGAVQAAGVWMRIAIVSIGFIVLRWQRESWKSEHPELYRLLKRCCIVLALLVPFASLASSLVDRFTLYIFFAYLLPIGRSVDFVFKKYRLVALIPIYGFSYAILILWFSLSDFARIWWTPYDWALPTFNLWL